jgi:acetyl-CoA acetyltransferase
MHPLRGRAAIAGIGATTYAFETDRSGFELAIDAIERAVADAGLEMTDVDGMVKYSVDSSASIERLAVNLGVEDLAYWAEVPHGGGASCATVQQAAAAVATGAATAVVCFRSFSPSDFGDGAKHNSNTLWARQAGVRDFLRTAGWTAMVDVFAMCAQRHMHEFGTTEEQLGEIVLTCRRHAAMNPAALRPDELKMDEYLASPSVSGPLKTPDCFILPSTGACAVVVTTAERAADLPQRPAYVLGAAAASGTSSQQYWELHPFRRGEITHTASRQVAGRLYAMAGLRPTDVDVAEFYDCYSYTLLAQLEDYGFCAKGEGGRFVEDGRIALGGALPVNTHGGHLGEAYIHGFNHVLEGVRQIRGTSTAQVDDAEVALVTGGTPNATSALILGAAR